MAEGTPSLTKAALARIKAASNPEITYEGLIYEGKRPRTDEWVTLRRADFDALAKAAGI